VTFASRIAREAEIASATVGRINPNFLPLVFDRFRQERRVYQPTARGFGAGLAIVGISWSCMRDLVEAFSAGEGKGSRFRRAATYALGTARVRDGGRVVHPTTSSILLVLRLLVVDDDPGARELIANVLQGYGAEVCLAETGQAALTKLFDHARMCWWRTLGCQGWMGTR